MIDFRDSGVRRSAQRPRLAGLIILTLSILTATAFGQEPSTSDCSHASVLFNTLTGISQSREICMPGTSKSKSDASQLELFLFLLILAHAESF